MIRSLLKKGLERIKERVETKIGMVQDDIKDKIDYHLHPGKKFKFDDCEDMINIRGKPICNYAMRGERCDYRGHHPIGLYFILFNGTIDTSAGQPEVYACNKDGNT